MGSVLKDSFTSSLTSPAKDMRRPCKIDTAQLSIKNGGRDNLVNPEDVWRVRFLGKGDSSRICLGRNTIPSTLGSQDEAVRTATSRLLNPSSTTGHFQSTMTRRRKEELARQQQQQAERSPSTPFRAEELYWKSRIEPPDLTRAFHPEQQAWTDDACTWNDHIFTRRRCRAGKLSQYAGDAFSLISCETLPGPLARQRNALYLMPLL
jgi:hypothetical protein